LQNPDYNEALKNVWSGIAIEKVDDYTVIFHLPKPYPLFLENLTTGILPRHLWVDIPVKDFTTSNLNLNAIGMGPYKIDSINRDNNNNISSIKFIASDFYEGGSPYIENIETKFYDNNKDLTNAFKTKTFLLLECIPLMIR